MWHRLQPVGFSLTFSPKERDRATAVLKRRIENKVAGWDGFKMSMHIWHKLRLGKSGTANLLIGVLPRANQEIGGPRK